MNDLVVSSYPPMPCGIGAYAEQHAGALRRAGNAVDVLSPEGGDGDYIVDLFGGWKIARLLKYAWAHDRIYIQYTPSFFFRGDSAIDRLRTRLGFLLLNLIFGRRIEYIIHETDYKVGDPMSGRGGSRLLDKLIWQLAGRIVFHSEVERDAFAKRFGFARDLKKFEVAEHGRHFVSKCRVNREEARRMLGIPEENTLFLCIGFIQPHKGFDRVIRAMRQVESARAMLRIVGSIRIAWQPAMEYAARLHSESVGDPRCEFIEEFVSDEAFDTWIVAADYVVVPYHEIWSSGVGARAALHGRTVIAADTGGLRDQLPPGTLFFTTDDELAQILKTIMKENGAINSAPPPAHAHTPRAFLQSSASPRS